ncbi:MAG: cobalamin biosynthesis protein CbiX [Verrucomicrobiota bacterium]
MATNRKSYPCTLLVDNGSLRAQATLNLRRLASALSERVESTVHPVSLLHSSKVDEDELQGVPADIFESFIQKRRAEGTHSFLIVPLFFGHSAAIYEYLPQRVMALRDEGWPELEVRIAPCLVDVGNRADTGVAEILASLVRKTMRLEKLRLPAVTLVDHGTPRVAVNRVRNFLAEQLAGIMEGEVSMVRPSSMERREGIQYDFNEPLLENLLGSEEFEQDVILSMLFLSPGRHAGPGGDIAQICADAEERNPRLKTHMSDLFTTSPKVIDLLLTRMDQGAENKPVEGEIAFPGSIRGTD